MRSWRAWIISKKIRRIFSSYTGQRKQLHCHFFPGRGRYRLKLDWQEQKELQAQKRRQQNALKKTEERIAELEQRCAEIDEEMTKEEIYTNSVKCQELASKKAGHEKELEELYETWAELAE